jgi:hypothetical protein
MLTTSSPLLGVKPLLEEGGGFSRVSEMRDTIQELQGELGSCKLAPTLHPIVRSPSEAQRVTDLLRDKLHHLSSQLADAQARVKDFEDTERGTLSILRERLDDKRDLEVLCSVGEHPCHCPRSCMETYVFVFSREQGRRPDRPSGEARTGECWCPCRSSWCRSKAHCCHSRVDSIFALESYRSPEPSLDCRT